MKKICFIFFFCLAIFSLNAQSNASAKPATVTIVKNYKVYDMFIYCDGQLLAEFERKTGETTIQLPPGERLIYFLSRYGTSSTFFILSGLFDLVPGAHHYIKVEYNTSTGKVFEITEEEASAVLKKFNK